jgi:HK97 family phage prohead protease
MENRMQTVTRAYNFELRAENNEAHGDHIVGRPIVYDSKTNLGYFNEIIERGALDNADLKDVRFLVNHNTDMIPLARSRNNNSNSTMQMSVDDEGMLIRVNLDTENNSDAKNLYSAIKRGDITGMSFMFSIDSEEWDDLESEHPTRRIKEIGRVLEVSAVTFPAYDATEISARDKEALDNAKAALESARSQSLENDADMLELEKAKLRNKFF